MKSSPEFPLKYLAHYIEKGLASDWNTYKSDLIEHTFYSPYDSVDEESFLVKVYNPDIEGFDLYSFEREVLRKIQNEIVIAVENISIGFSRRLGKDELVESYAMELKDQYQSIVQNSSNFPFLAKHLEPILDIIHHYSPKSKDAFHDNDTIIEIATSKPTIAKRNVIRVKPNIRIRLFKELYELAVYHGIIDGSQISWESFLSVFTNDNNQSKVIFACKNSKAAFFLECLTPIFVGFNGRIIEEAKAFQTKQGKLFKESNYNTSKFRAKEKDYSELKEAIDNLIDEYIQ